MDLVTHYEALGLEPTATQAEIRKAWQHLAATYHPDNIHTADREKFQAVTDAYSTLRDPELRAAYDLGEQDPVAELLPKLGGHMKGMREAAQRKDYWDLGASTAGLLGTIFQGVGQLKKRKP